MWYESKVVTVVVGALLGFLLSYVPSRLDRYYERRSLKRALLAEVARVASYLGERRATYARYRGMVAEGGRLGVYTTNRTFDVVYRANAGRLAMIDAKLVKLFVDFYDGVNEFAGRIRALSDSLDKFNAGTDKLTDTEFFVRALDRLLEVIDRTVAVGKQLLSTRMSG